MEVQIYWDLSMYLYLAGQAQLELENGRNNVLDFQATELHSVRDFYGRMIIVCAAIENRRKIVHRMDQEVSSIMDRPESLMTNAAIWKITRPLAVAWDIWMRTLYFQANTKVKEGKRRNGFTFGMKPWSSVLGKNSLHQCQLFLLLVNLIWRSPCCIWSDVRWRLLYLWNVHSRLSIF